MGPESPPTVVSIHNLAYQGIADRTWLERIGPDGAHYEWWGGTNPLSGALALANRIVAVSPNYAREIQTPTGGFGLDGPLGDRYDAIIGILNGIDTEVWNPATDRHLPAAYTASSLDGKAASRTALTERLGFPDDSTPLATVVARLTGQKGIDLLIPLIPLLDQIPMRLAVLGSGDGTLAAELRRLAERHPRSFAFVEGYDEALSHLMFAGGDLFVVPSRFEPCGLTQMQAMRYGTPPIVTSVGGLVDTVPDVDRDRAGLGFVADTASPEQLLAAMFRATRHIRTKRRRVALQKRIMAIDWSWTRPAARYVGLYEELMADR
jgi:starch synthase